MYSLAVNTAIERRTTCRKGNKISHKFVRFIRNLKRFGLISQGGVGPHRLAMRSPIFFLFFGKKVRVTQPTLYHEPTIKAPNIGYIKFSLPLLTGPPESIGMWVLILTNFCLICTLIPYYNQRGQIMSPPTFLTFRWP